MATWIKATDRLPGIGKEVKLKFDDGEHIWLGNIIEELADMVPEAHAGLLWLDESTPTTTVGGSEKERCPYELFVIKYFGLPENVSFDKVPKVTYADIVSILAMYSEQEHSLSIKEFAEKEANKHFNKDISSYAWEACVSSCVAGAAHAQQSPSVDIGETLAIKFAAWNSYCSLKEEDIPAEWETKTKILFEQWKKTEHYKQLKIQPTFFTVDIVEALEKANPYKFDNDSQRKLGWNECCAKLRELIASRKTLNKEGQEEQEQNKN